MTNETDRTEDEGLEAVFARARAAAPPPRPAFLETVMSDALAEMPRLFPQQTAAWTLGGVLRALGGWSMGAALGGAAAAGLAMGYYDPAALGPSLGVSDGAELSASLDEPLLGFLGEDES